MTRGRAARLALGAALVTVLAAAQPPGHSPASTGSAHTVAAPSRSYRFVRAPIAIVQSTPDGPVFQVRIRLNRRLPVDRQGVAANVLLAGAGADAPPVPFGIRSRRCYAAVIGDDFDAPGLHGAAAGRWVRLVVRVPGVRPSLVTRVALKSRAQTNVASLGCR